MQLARAVRNRTTGVLYVLDEPLLGCTPANITGLTGVMQDLIHDATRSFWWTMIPRFYPKPIG